MYNCDIIITYIMVDIYLQPPHHDQCPIYVLMNITDHEKPCKPCKEKPCSRNKRQKDRKGRKVRKDRQNRKQGSRRSMGDRNRE